MIGHKSGAMRPQTMDKAILPPKEGRIALPQMKE